MLNLSDTLLIWIYLFLCCCVSGGGWIYWAPPRSQTRKPRNCQHAHGDGTGGCERTGKGRATVEAIKWVWGDSGVHLCPNVPLFFWTALTNEFHDNYTM